MPSTVQLRERLTKKLNELFQLDQPDLDFGFYRIMHMKAKQVSDFIDKDLLKVISDAFGIVDEAKTAALQAEYEKAIQTAKDFGAPNPDETSGVKKAKAALDAARDSASIEGEIYDHLYHFFERYYDDGDFISRRYYARENSEKAAPFALPYNGEEVKLHWANADQYYIKTSEYFSNYTFDLRRSNQKKDGALGGLQTSIFDMVAKDTTPLMVHFHIVDATEGEHGNVKASDTNKRFFIIHEPKPVEVDGQGELVVNFEYRSDPEKGGQQEKAWRAKRNAEAVDFVIKAVTELAKTNKGLHDYIKLFTAVVDPEKDKKKTYLEKHIEQYTTRNTMDYFIHKDLSGFLRRELDFYIKNEVMRLDDIENADVPAVEMYLAKIKVLRKIAGKLIDFLAQLENFQKKLWLKKKFVVETNYCITLDRIPEELYAEIAANNAQREEWVRLFGIDEIEGDLSGPGYSVPLDIEFLKANDKLVLDTRYFNEQFKQALLEKIDDFEEQCDGLLLHSENFQGLRLLKDRYYNQIQCTYIDPPYNSDASPILYKNSYKSSSWITLMEDRIKAQQSMLSDEGVLVSAIDDVQYRELSFLVSGIFCGSLLGTICVRSNPSGRPTQTGYAVSHEYLIYAGNTDDAMIGRLPPTEDQAKRFSEQDDDSAFEWRNLRREGSNSDRKARRGLYYPIYIRGAEIVVPQMTWDKTNENWVIEEQPIAGDAVVYPINDDDVQKTWRWSPKKVKASMKELSVRKDRTGKDYIYYKRRINKKGVVSVSSWFDAKYSATEYGTALLKDLFFTSPFSYPKSLYAVKDAIYIAGAADENCYVLDYFAGSATTAHATIDLNRDDEGNRKYILIEMGDYFDSVTKPRVLKVIYSKDWKDGKPTARNTGISHCCKYLRLESYEDTLNNLEFAGSAIRDAALAASPTLREDYTLHYLLDVETRGSKSLLNIDGFSDPTAYQLKVKKPGSDEQVVRNVDLIETFNYLIGLRVNHIAAPQSFTANFKRDLDPELPDDQNTKLVLDGRMKLDASGPWWFRKIEGWLPKDPNDPNNGQRDKVMVVWRKLTGDQEKDNVMLDAWFEAIRVNPRDFEFDVIYVNGSNNLPNLRKEEESWKVRLIEEEFMKRMWDTENA